jgi:hypothetical protein
MLTRKEMESSCRLCLTSRQQSMRPVEMVRAHHQVDSMICKQSMSSPSNNTKTSAISRTYLLRTRKARNCSNWQSKRRKKLKRKLQQRKKNRKRKVHRHRRRMVPKKSRKRLKKHRLSQTWNFYGN